MQETLLRTMVILVFLCIIRQGLVGISMDPDGLIYASIASHLAGGHGSLWFPYSMFDEPAFHHHPPLGFFLQSQFFRLFGDGFYVENLYQIVVLLLLLYVMRCAWRVQRGEREGAWFAWLMLFCMPVVAYSFTDNLLENTLALFAAGAVLAQLYAVKTAADTSLGRLISWCLLAAVMTVAAVLVKGPVGLFPLTALLILGIADRLSWRGILFRYALYLVPIAIITGCLVGYEASRESLRRYIEFQLVGTFEGLRPMIHGRGYLAFQLMRDLLLPALLVAVIAWFNGLRWSRSGLAWCVIALSASIPLFLSPRQFDYYLVPSLPFYALFFASIVADPVRRLRVNRLIYLKAASAALVILLVVGGVRDFGTLDHDVDQIRDMALIRDVVPAESNVGICVSVDSVYRLVMYLSRYHGVRALPLSGQDYVLCREPPPGYQPVDLDLRMISLHVRRDLRSPP